MKDNDIRPASIMTKQEILIDKDAVNLSKKTRFFKKVECPSCGSKKSIFFLRKRFFNYQICSKCETYFMSPRPTEKILDNHYRTSLNMKYWSDKIFPISRKKRIKYIYKPRAIFLIKSLKKLKRNNRSHSYLEIGAADGTFAKEIRRLKYFKKYLLVEPNPRLAKQSIKSKFDVFNGMFEELNSAKKFDCISTFEVIEHIYSPFNFLKKCNEKLNKKGIIFFSCPNGNGFDVSLMQEKSNVIDHEHLNYFNTKSIKLLLRRSGFKPLSITTPGKLDFELTKNFIKNTKITNKFEHSIKWISYINDKDSKLIQKIIQRNNISSHMFVIAEKK